MTNDAQINLNNITHNRSGSKEKTMVRRNNGNNEKITTTTSNRFKKR